MTRYRNLASPTLVAMRNLSGRAEALTREGPSQYSSITKSADLDKIYGKYNAHLYPSKNRYVIKDKSPYKQYIQDLENIRKTLKENAYFQDRVSEVQKKCLSGIESSQKYWYSFKRRNKLVPLTKYDPEKPNLWMRVKDITGGFIEHIRRQFRFVRLARRVKFKCYYHLHFHPFPRHLHFIQMVPGRNFLKSAEKCARFSMDSRPHIYHNVPNLVKKSDISGSKASKFYGAYNIQLPEESRYVVTDRSPCEFQSRELKNLRKNFKENIYLVKKSAEVKKKYFENIRLAQEHWYKVKRKNNVLLQTSYDPENPNLWLTVKEMYHTRKLYL